MATRTILVEDSETIREALIPTLAELADAEVIVVAQTAAEGILALATHDWELAIVDMQLKQGTGLAVLRAGQGRAPYQHMIGLSNYATPDIRRRCMEAGADAVFDKSTEVEAFLEKCRSYAGQERSPSPGD
ncbi:MAG TPA: response regulator [Caldimonas sp.]|jgi:DNA-binding NarL/FixJ family response regulator|nr:response regulator [Caldimonas sp.]HEX2539537.1 response regulator [Caldimonas sp.]